MYRRPTCARAIEEIEELGYYDFMGYMEVPFFNISGGIWGGGELEGAGAVKLRVRGAREV